LHHSHAVSPAGSNFEAARHVMSKGACMRLVCIVPFALALLAAPLSAAEVDLELVLAADGSGSIDDEELRLQREGWASAITSPEVLDAIKQGLIGTIVVQYMEWGAFNSQVVIVDWTEISDAASAAAFADALRSRPRGAFGYNSISAAIDFSVAQVEANRWQGLRKVIDVSADAGNRGGRDMREARDEAVAKGYTINALTIDRGKRPGLIAGYPTLEDYFAKEVIGGPGAFVEIANAEQPFMTAARRKLVQEIAGLPVLQQTARTDSAARRF
jgi:Protein of unknown function (DUF1194)